MHPATDISPGETQDVVTSLRMDRIRAEFAQLPPRERIDLLRDIALSEILSADFQQGQRVLSTLNRAVESCRQTQTERLRDGLLKRL